MQKCFERFVCGEWGETRNSILVLDVGGADVNGSYADIFSGTKYDYVAADLTPGPGVSLVLEEAYKIPYGDESVDLVISGQVFEHVEFFWDLFREMSRVVTRDGFIFLIAPSAGPIHRYPVDCYRFYPDAYSALAKYANLETIDLWLDDRGPWNDLVGVFAKTPRARPDLEELRRRARTRSALNAYMLHKTPAPVLVKERDEATERVQGQRSYIEVLRAIHEIFKPRFYFEIGVRKGGSLALASCPTIGVDPDPGKEASEVENARIYTETSDFFFEFSAQSALASRSIDLAFIDGMHQFEFALRDFINIESRSEPTSIIVIDDIFPNNPTQASRSRQSRVWSGDVWKLYHCLKTRRPDLRILALDASPTGLLVIGCLDSANRSLLRDYNPLVRAYRDMRIEEYASLILEREGAIPPMDDRLFEFLRKMRDNRSSEQRRSDAGSVS